MDLDQLILFGRRAHFTRQNLALKSRGFKLQTHHETERYDTNDFCDTTWLKDQKQKILGDFLEGGDFFL